jgi:peptide deformylase
MFLTMYAHGGIGLAASQIGILERVAVVDISPDQSQKLVLINPEITERLGSVSSEEGCLSIPEYRDTIKRSERIQVSAQDIEGNPQLISADGMLAICIQHEVDHLNGTLFVDHLSRLKREFFKRWLKKQGIAQVSS